MFKISTILFSLVASGLVFADAEVVSNDVLYQSEGNSPHTQVCMAALESKELAKSTAIELGIGRRELNKIRCNELSVMEFAKLNGNQIENWSIATVQ